jgi:hypothetical protein
MVRLMAVAMSVLMLTGATKAPTPTDTPADLSYTADGQMKYPEHYREWIYLSSGLGMRYDPGAPLDHPNFDNVFVNPTAYKVFMATGIWPDKTVLVLEVRNSETKASIDQRGRSQSGLRGLEVHVRDESLPGKWGFFEFDPGQASTKMVPRPADCYSCHEQHAAVDTTFVQFYPTLIDTAKAKKTLSPEYLKELPLLKK